jgi:hypothetical protein
MFGKKSSRSAAILEGLGEVLILLVLSMLIERSSRSDLGQKTQNSKRLGLGSFGKSYKSWNPTHTESILAYSGGMIKR